MTRIRCAAMTLQPRGALASPHGSGVALRRGNRHATFHEEQMARRSGPEAAANPDVMRTCGSVGLIPEAETEQLLAMLARRPEPATAAAGSTPEGTQRNSETAKQPLKLRRRRWGG